MAQVKAPPSASKTRGKTPAKSTGRTPAKAKTYVEDAPHSDALSQQTKAATSAKESTAEEDAQSAIEMRRRALRAKMAMASPIRPPTR